MIRAGLCFTPRLGKCSLPSGAVGDGMQQAPRMIHMVRVTGRNELPAVAGRISCRNTERGHEPFLAVSPVVRQRLPDHFRETSTRRPA